MFFLKIRIKTLFRKKNTMKLIMQPGTAGLKVLTYFLIMWLATFIAGIIPWLNSLFYFWGVSLLISWLLLRSDHLNLSSLNCIPQNRKHWRQLFAGVFSGCLMLIVTAIITLTLTRASWHYNQNPGIVNILITFMMCASSAYIQEFVFRGYPFQTLLRRYGPWQAQILIAIPFALMHINRSMSLQDVAPVMLTTGLGSLLFGLAYIKTRNLMLPVGLHLGWNFAQALIPRTANTDSKVLITVVSDPGNYSFFTIILPYLLIFTIGCIFLGLTNFEKKETGSLTNEVS